MTTEARETNREYHSDTQYISHSMLEVFRRSPALYEGQFVTGDIPREQTGPMALGSLVHAMVLEPETVETEFLLTDCKTRRGKAWDDAVAEGMSDGKTPMPIPEIEKAEAIADAVRAHANAMMLIGHDRAIIEESIRWNDDGLLCKAKIDVRIPLDHNTLVVDLKTAADPSPEAFGKAVWNYGYHRQAAWYLRGVGEPASFFFIVVGKEPPHEVWVYEMARDYVRLGHEQNADDAARLVACMESGEWVDPRQREIQLVETPRWAS